MTVLHLPEDRGRSAPVPVALWVQGEVARGRLTLAEAARRVRRGGDPEAIHDLRVASRRLAATLGLWREMLPSRRRRRATRSLRRLRRRLGRARELEVSVALLEERLATGAGAGPALGEWLEARRRRRDRARARARRLVGRPRLERLEARVSKPVERLAGAAVDEAAAWADAARRAGALRLEALTRLTASAGSGDDAALHAARIALKRYRYAAEALTRSEGRAGGESLKSWKGLQESLGAIHDRALLRDLLRRRSRRWRARARLEPAQAAEALAATLEAERRSELERLRARLSAFPGPASAPSA